MIIKSQLRNEPQNFWFLPAHNLEIFHHEVEAADLDVVVFALAVALLAHHPVFQVDSVIMLDTLEESAQHVVRHKRILKKSVRDNEKAYNIQ